MKSSGQWWACPSHWKLWPQELLRQLLPGSASLGREGARPAPGSWDGLLGHDRASTVGLICSAGLGLPCPACRLPGSPPRVLDLRLGEGPHRPCPGCPPSSRRKPPGPAYSSAASCRTRDRPSTWPDPGLVLSVTPAMWPPPQTQPKSSTRRLRRGGLGEPPSPGQGTAWPTGCLGPGGVGPRL